MSKISNTLTHSVRNIVNEVVNKFTRIAIVPSDFMLHMKVGKDKIVFEVNPESAYGRFALEQLYEAHAKEEISAG